MYAKNTWEKYKDNLNEVMEYNEGYKDYISKNKTERACVKDSIRLAKEKGFKPLDSFETLKPGDKVYVNNRDKNIALFVIGNKPLIEGMRILGAHIDSPRMDLKQNPLYESEGFALADTHYYGGVKKYQWVALPLAIHGVIAKKDGTVVNVSIGDDENDPVFCVSDLLIHLAGEQLEKKASKVIEGENLDILFGSKPLKDKEKDAVKTNILGLLKEKYQMDEEDFMSAELEVVPAGKAKNAGLDSSMIMAYGQDDRVCAYTSLKAMLDVTDVKRTACCLLVDKEEIGSVGATGMRSKFFENTVCEIIDRLGGYNELKVRRCLKNSTMLSSDVNAAYDPLYASAFEKKNASYFGRGMVFSKFTGSRGKSGSNDANAEYIAKIRKIMDEADVCYQLAELGKVDVGGGGTIAYILSLYGMEVIDCGVAVLNMHAPWEITSKADIFETKKGYEIFLKNM